MKKLTSVTSIPIILIALALVPTIFVSGCATVDGNGEECREVLQPYVETECTEVEEGGTCTMKNIEFTETFKEETTCSGYACQEEETVCTLTIQNTDKEGGSWKYSTWVVLNGIKQNIGEQQIYVNATESRNVIWKQSHSPDATTECGYEAVSVPQRQVCTLCEEVTKYQTVEICE